MTLTAKVAGRSTRNCYHISSIAAANRLRTGTGTRTRSSNSLLSNVVAGRDPLNTALNRSRYRAVSDSPQQQRLAKGRWWCRSNSNRLFQDRRFHASTSTRLKPTMASTAQTKADGANGAASTWIGHEGAAAFDLRSDTMTTPTAEMLAAIQTATLLDDVFEEDPTTQELEAHVASLAGKEAGLFVLSGTMGNQVALRTLLTQPPYGVLCDYRSHIVKYEGGAVSFLTGATIQPVRPANGLYLTLADVEAHAVLSDDVHACPTRVVSLENPLDGVVAPLAEVRRIAAFARARGLKVHCDGARLWEAAASGAGSLRDFAAACDTASLCFSKGLGAPVGSVVVGSRAAVRQARRVRKMLGGGLRQSGVVAAAARVAVDRTFGVAGPRGEGEGESEGGLLRATHEAARRVAALWREEAGGELALPAQTNMCWLDLASAGTTAARVEQLGREAGLRLMGNRIVTHYQVGEEALRRLAGVFRTIGAERGSRGSGCTESGGKEEQGAGGSSSPYGVKA